MKKVVKPILSSRDVLYIAVWITLVYFYFINLLESVVDSGVIGRIYVIGVFLMLVGFAVLRGRIPRIRINILWLLSLVVILLSSSKAIRNGNYYWASMYLTLIVLLFVLGEDAEWTTKLWNNTLSLGKIHIGATILFFVCSPWLYEAIMLNIWGGELPGGCTINDAYKAGLTNHFSTNGIYCAIVFILFGVRLIVRQNSRIRSGDVVPLLIALIVLLLTTKRGVLLFALFACAVTYYICNPKDGIRKGFYIFVVVLIALIVFVMLAPYISLFGNILDRFVNTEDISNNRFLFWNQAYSLFLENKLLGIGWGQYTKVNYYGTSAHNIYIQLLCETGIIGFVIFVAAMIGTYSMAIRDYQKQAQFLAFEYKSALASAIAVQTFTLVYGITGNCLYDMTVFIYFLSCAASWSIHNMLISVKKTPRVP